MEVASYPLNLVIGDKNYILGLSSNIKHFECEIDIIGYMHWTIKLDKFLLCYKSGEYHLSELNTTSKPYLNKLDVNYQNQFMIDTVINEAKKQRHGTLIIITDSKTALDETERLSNYGRGIRIKKINLYKKTNIIMNISSINGALIMDTNCNCYGIGIILDGNAVSKGNMARGARFNSAINYVENKKLEGKNVLAVIISEDKTIDYY